MDLGWVQVKKSLLAAIDYNSLSHILLVGLNKLNSLDHNFLLLVVVVVGNGN